MLKGASRIVQRQPAQSGGHQKILKGTAKDDAVYIVHYMSVCLEGRIR